MRALMTGLMALVLTLPLFSAPLTAGATEAFVLLNNAALFKEKSLGQLEWLENLTVGDKLSVVSGVIKAKYNGAEREYYKVKTPGGKEGFVRTIFLGIGGTLGVVKVESSFVYSEPRDVKITDRTLLRGQIVVVLKEGATDQFIQVVGYDEAKDSAFTSAFVAKEEVSINDVDANAVILLAVAKAQKNVTLKKNLLTVASTKYSTSVFMDLINAQLNALNPNRASKPAVGTFLVNDKDVNVRDLPNEKASKVVKALEKGTQVTITEVTTESYTIDGQTAPWYRIAEPAGWVFGAFLSPAP